MPHFISVVVIVSMLNIFLSPGSGILGRFFGDESLMGSTSAITAVYWISEVWQHVGWNSIIYLAALAGVDTSLYEAAKIDGAGRLQLIRYVDLPAIMPTCAILLIMNMGSVLNVGFDKIYLMQNSLNMPATEVIATYTYKIGIINGQYSYSTAIGLFNTLVNFVFLVAVLYPLWFVVIASFSDPNAVAGGEVTLLPKGVTFVGYAKVFANHRIWQGYLNTIIYSVVGTAVNMAVTIPCAFALSRREFKPRRVIMFLFTVTMFISGGLIPNYLLYKALGINNTMWVFILPGAVSVYNVIVARSFFETSIPEELHDAAQIDGLSYFGYFFKIVLPLSSAILAVIGLYYFVGHWNDFMTGLIYITDDTKQPLQVVLQQLLLVAQGTGTNVNAAAQQQAADQIKFGIIIVSTLPLLVLYPFLQKYFNKGVMLGAVKG